VLGLGVFVDAPYLAGFVVTLGGSDSPLGVSVIHVPSGSCWRSLSIKFNFQINKEKDPNATDIQTYGFIWQNSTSFGVFLFLQGVMRKYGRDINKPRNYLTSRRVQKPRERTGDRTGSGAGRPPWPGVQSELFFGIKLHRPKRSRITVQSMSVWSNGPYSLGRTIKPDPLAPGGESFSTLIHYSSRERKPLIKPRATTLIRYLD